MDKTNGFLTIDYDDSDASTYKSITIMCGDKKEIKFNTGNPLIDWYDYCKFIFDGFVQNEGIFSIAHSSSIDHWFMDTDEYLEKYLKLQDDGTYDFMTNDEINSLPMLDLYTYKKCVIHKDMKTFQELKDYYKNNKL